MRGMSSRPVVLAALFLGAIIICAGCGRPPLKYESLWESAAKGAVTDIPQHLANGTAINAADEEGNTALMAAAAAGQLEVVQFLLRKGADVNAKNQAQESAAFQAAASGHADVLEALIAKGAAVNARDAMGTTMLFAAVQKGDTGVCKALLDAGADPNETVRSLDFGLEPQAALWVAVSAGNVQIVQLLISKGADVRATDERGRNRALGAAVDAKHLDVAELIKAELRARDPEGYARMEAKERELDCLTNLKQLGLALAMYKTDYDGAWPLARQLSSTLEPYTKNPELWHCPSWDATRPGYVMNKGLAGVREAMVLDPAGVLALFECDRGAEPLFGGPGDLLKSPRHPAGNNFGFCDGHVKPVSVGGEPAAWWGPNAQ